MTAVFIWFGVSQLINTSAWVSLVPGWATGIFGLTAADVVHMNGVFEIIAGCMLVLGIYVRVVALLLGLHLIVIAGELGITAIGVRDFGLSFATLSVALFGTDRYCLSHKEI